MRILTIVALVLVSTATAKADDLGGTGRWVAATFAKAAHSEWDTLLKDYPSARFRHVYIEFAQFKDRPSVWFMCGEVNSKSGFDAYGGWHNFALGQGANDSIVIATDDGHGSDTLEDVWKFYNFYCNRIGPARFSEDTSKDYSAEMSYPEKRR